MAVGLLNLLGVDVTSIGTALQALCESLLSTLVRLTGHSGLVGLELAGGDDDAVNGDDETVLEVDDVTAVQVVDVDLLVVGLAFDLALTRHSHLI